MEVLLGREAPDTGEARTQLERYVGFVDGLLSEFSTNLWVRAKVPLHQRACGNLYYIRREWLKYPGQCPAPTSPGSPSTRLLKRRSSRWSALGELLIEAHMLLLTKTTMGTFIMSLLCSFLVFFLCHDDGDDDC